MPWYQGRPCSNCWNPLPSSEIPHRAISLSRAARAASRSQFSRICRTDRFGNYSSGRRDYRAAFGRPREVARIVTWDGDLAEAPAPLSVTLVLDRELDISRGDLIVPQRSAGGGGPQRESRAGVDGPASARLNRRYLLKHTSQTVPAFLTAVDHRTGLATLAVSRRRHSEMNDIGVVTLNLLRPIALDRYGENRGTGAFILIDADTNGTVAAGMVTAASSHTGHGDDD